MAELVERRVEPSLARDNVANDAHIAFAIDVRTERVLGLSIARVEITSLEDRCRLHAEAEIFVERAGDRYDVAIAEERLQ
jgi:hypothetical protein